MVDGLVSIIVPIYNVEKYLERCIDSIVNQTYINLEIILVDDGSPDNCPFICDEWAKKDSRIKVIHKENAGLGMARNTGIESARGEYLCFFDSDDYIALDTVEKIMATAKSYDAELILFGYSKVDRNGNVSSFFPHMDKYYYHGDDVQRVVLPAMIGFDPDTGEKTNLSMSACFCAYNYSLIFRNAWHFVSEREIISEDVYSMLCLMSEVKKVAIIPEVFYFYCENESSLTHTYHQDRYKRLKFFYNISMKKCNELRYNEDVKERFSHSHMNNVIAALKLIVKSDLQRHEKKESVKEIIIDDQLQTIIHRMKIQKEKLARKLLFFAIKQRWIEIVYWMIKVKV